MTAHDIGKYVMQHKSFLMHYVYALVFAFVLLVFSLGFVVYSNQPSNAPLITRVALHIMPHIVEHAIDYGFNLSWSHPANLSSSQWQALRTILATMPPACDELYKLEDTSKNRRSRLFEYANWVFSHSSELPHQTLDDWNTLRDIKFETIPNSADVNKIQQEFISETLPAHTVTNVISMYDVYANERAKVIQSNLLTDRIVTALEMRGLTFESSDYTKEHTGDPGRSIEDYSPGIEFPPIELPPLNLTSDQVDQQLKQPPLSNGATSAERAES